MNLGSPAEFNTPANRSITDGLAGLANLAIDRHCDFYRDYPGLVTGGIWGSPLAGIQKGINDTLCKDRGPRPLPPAAVPPPSGGQCAGVRYQVFFTAQQPGGAPINSSVLVLGPVGTLVQLKLQNQLAWRLYHGFMPGIGSSQIIAGNFPDNSTCSITSIVPNPAGGANNCGNGQPTLPPVMPPGYNPEDYGPVNGPSVAPDGTVPYVPPSSPRAPLPLPPSIPLPPIVWSPGGGLAPWRLPGTITIQPTVNANIQLNFGPFNFNIGPNSINVDLSPKFDTDNPSPRIPGGRDPGLPPAEGCCDEIKEIKERVDKIPAPGDFTRVLFSSVDVSGGFSVSLPAKCALVEVEVLQIPTNARRQAGVGAKDVLWAGWGWFGYGGPTVGAREPIDADRKAYTPPSSWLWGNDPPQSFQGTLYVGFTGRVNVYNWVENE